MTSARLAPPRAAAASPELPDAPASLGGSGGGAWAGVFATHAEAIAEARLGWQQACFDGSSAEQVQRRYEWYRGLVIAQVASVVAGRPARAS